MCFADKELVLILFIVIPCALDFKKGCVDVFYLCSDVLGCVGVT